MADNFSPIKEYDFSQQSSQTLPSENQQTKQIFEQSTTGQDLFARFKISKKIIVFIVVLLVLALVQVVIYKKSQPPKPRPRANSNTVQVQK